VTVQLLAESRPDVRHCKDDKANGRLYGVMVSKAVFELLLMAAVVVALLVVVMVPAVA
jgi:hypothetical protein